MKLILLLTTLLSATLSSVLFAQPPSSKPLILEKMSPFQEWVGQWKGEGSVQRGPQNTAKSSVLENIESKLDGTIIVVEGTGKAIEGNVVSDRVVHHAFGVLSYDVTKNKYRFETYLADGNSTEAWFNVLGNNQYQWGFEVPGGKVRYTITIDPVAKTWHEVGEYSRDDAQWLKMFEMKLNKI